ncbi:P1 family peptidase [Amphibacillus sediminis]|uniref:P1 family peptidase n=1 Tax=Amphibacillus sediminis TaxID=360185 RepID=UPI0008302838|nr:P1 family peptidase [Amphibacillus sediminis]
MQNVISINQLNQFKIGHAENDQAITGCTVVLAENGAKAGVSVRGGSPGTRETDLLKSENLVDIVHGVFFTGGSAFGLDVGTGVMRYLEERKIGFDTQIAHIPIVPGAVLYDLIIGQSHIRPDAQLGYQACLNAQERDDRLGNVGAGLGATVGKCLGPDYGMKAGLGHYALQVGELMVAALIAVNCFGDIIDPKTGQILAGVYDRGTKQLLNSEQMMLKQLELNTNRFSGNTTIGTVLTNAKANKAQLNKIASIAHDGIARTTRPSHTFIDGDTLFALSCDQVEADLNVVAMLATTAVEQAIVSAARTAKSLAGFPSHSETQ